MSYFSRNVPILATSQAMMMISNSLIITTSALVGFGCVIINLYGSSVSHFWAALFLLGLSWNFMFIGATTLLTETYTPAERAKTQAVNEFSVFTVVVGVIICGLIAASIRMGDRKYWCFAFVERGIAQRFMAQIYPA